MTEATDEKRIGRGGTIWKGKKGINMNHEGRAEKKNLEERLAPDIQPLQENLATPLTHASRWLYACVCMCVYVCVSVCVHLCV
jgi:hypothetical protein